MLTPKHTISFFAKPYIWTKEQALVVRFGIKREKKNWEAAERSLKMQ
jgi:hypothetical protein